MVDFFKYHGLGNDFIVLDRDREEFAVDRVRRLCDRRRGIGADGVLVVSNARESRADAKMTLYNRDGTRPEMCGNGIRCVVRHVVEQGRASATAPVIVETDDGLRTCRVTDAGGGAWSVAVDMGTAEVGESAVTRTADGVRREFYPVDVGNPHAVSFGSAADSTVDSFGEELNAGDEAFPEGVNVEFVDVHAPDRIEVVVYERGVGRTRACGTGACAAAAASRVTGRVDADQSVRVDLPGGPLEIERDETQSIWMTGPARAVFHGEFDAAAP
jgi:diaminopimelate epimerase